MKNEDRLRAICAEIDEIEAALDSETGAPMKCLTCGARWLETDTVTRLSAKNKRLQAALENVAGFGDVDLSGEWPGPLRDVIRSMTDCAKRALD